MTLPNTDASMQDKLQHATRKTSTYRVTDLVVLIDVVERTGPLLTRSSNDDDDDDGAGDGGGWVQQVEVLFDDGGPIF